MDLYGILNVQKGCSDEELKKSYKKLCIQHHPDKGGNEEEFKKISEAYNILKDPEKRKIYDTYGMEGLRGGMGANFGSDFQSMMESVFGGMGGMGDMMGMMGGHPFGKPQSKEHVKKILKIKLEDIVNGKSDYPIYLTRRVIDKNKIKKKCMLCQGQGFRIMNTQMGFMQMQQKVVCPQCRGQCFENLNELFITKDEKILLNIPKNCAENHVFKLIDKMDEKPDGSSGDIILIVKYDEHPDFHRIEYDLFYYMNLSFSETFMGFSKPFQLLNGQTINISYPHIIKWNEMLVLPNQGLYNHQTQKYGNLLIGFNINYPDKFNIDDIKGTTSKDDINLSLEPNNMITQKLDISFFKSRYSNHNQNQRNHQQQVECNQQ